MVVNGQKDNTQSLTAKIDIHKFRQFKASSVEEYEQKLQRMSTYDLAEEATRWGYRPSTERVRIIRNLLGEFKKAKASYDILNGNLVPPPPISEDKQKIIREMSAFLR